MGYNYKKVKEELIEKKLADDGLVAWGQKPNTGAVWGAALGGAIGAAIASSASAGTANKFAFTKMGDKIAVFPMTNKEIKYKEAYAFEKDKIKKAKASVWNGFKLVTVDGKVYRFNVGSGMKDLKTILEKLEIPKK